MGKEYNRIAVVVSKLMRLCRSLGAWSEKNEDTGKKRAQTYKLRGRSIAALIRTGQLRGHWTYLDARITLKMTV